MERFCEEHAPRMFEDIYDAIFNDEKQSPSEKRRNLRKSRVVAVLHNLSFVRNQVVYCKLPNIEIKVILENKKGET